MANDSIKRLYVKDVETWKNSLDCKRFSERELEVKVVENGIVLPARIIKYKNTYEGGVCDSDFNFIAGYSRTKPNDKSHGGGGFATISQSYVVEHEIVVKLDEDIIFGGCLIGHFGHFILECWSRLWYVIQHPELQSKILFITTSHGGYKTWFDDFFRLMGIDLERIVYVKQPTQCRSVTVPDQASYVPERLRFGLGTFTKEFLIPYQAIKSRVQPSKIKKLYLTRVNFDEGKALGGSHCFNEKYFAEFFSEHGFNVISPEKLSIEEQISLIMGADEIAATMGTLTHFAMFCKPETKFIMLTRTHETLPFQNFVNEAFDVNYYFVDVSKNFMYAEQTLGVCMLGSNRYWKEFVADYFGERINEDDDNSYFSNSLDRYINFWCERYSTEKNLNLYVSSLKDMCSRIVALEKERETSRPILNYQIHVGKSGWGTWIAENQLSNSLDQKLDIQAIKIAFSEPFYEIYYSIYYNAAEGWSEEVSTSQMAGTIGKSKSITGIKIRLDETGTKEFDILYRMHKFDGQWTDWAKNGEALYSYGVQLNAIQIKLLVKLENYGGDIATATKIILLSDLISQKKTPANSTGVFLCKNF